MSYESMHYTDLTSEVTKACAAMSEKKRICKMCTMNNGQCDKKQAFLKDFVTMSCPSFKLRKGSAF